MEGYAVLALFGVKMDKIWIFFFKLPELSPHNEKFPHKINDRKNIKEIKRSPFLFCRLQWKHHLKFKPVKESCTLSESICVFIPFTDLIRS